MATSNITLTTSWTQLATSSDLDLLVTFTTPVTVEVAMTSANSAPTVVGHYVSNSDLITRSITGPGYVWAKLIGGSIPSSAVLVVSK